MPVQNWANLYFASDIRNVRIAKLKDGSTVAVYTKSGGTDVFAQLYNVDTSKRGDEIRIPVDASYPINGSPQVITYGNGFGVAYGAKQSSGTSYRVAVTAYDVQGNAAHSVFTREVLVLNSSQDFSIAATTSHIVVKLPAVGNSYFVNSAGVTSADSSRSTAYGDSIYLVRSERQGTSSEFQNSITKLRADGSSPTHFGTFIGPRTTEIVALGEEKILVTWQQAGSTSGVIMSADGSTGPMFELGPVADTKAVALTGGGFAVSYRQEVDSSFQTFVRLFDPTGRLLDTVAMHTSSTPLLADLGDGRLGVVRDQSIEILDPRTEPVVGKRLDNAGEQFAGTLFNDKVTGGNGNDFIFGHWGSDTIVGSLGADRLDGGEGIDWLSYEVSGGAETVNLATGLGSGWDAAGDTLRGFENVIGSSHADTLIGDDNPNDLVGGGGNDILEGGKGADRLDGGAGDDTAVFSGDRADFRVLSAGSLGYFVRDSRLDGLGSDLLTSIEFIRFDGPGGSSTHAIADVVEPAPVMSITPEEAVKAEGNEGVTDFTFKVTRTSSDISSSATWTVTGLSAGSVVVASGRVRFSMGETEKIITIQVRGDLTPEADETFRVTLSDAQDATLGQAVAEGKVLNDDGEPPLPVMSIAPDDAVNAEGDDGLTEFTFKVTRSSGNGASKATWTVTGLSADEVVALSGPVEFAHGQTVQTITIQVRGDLTPEADEAFTVTLSDPQGATLGQASAEGKVLNDDGEPPPPPVLSIAPADAVKAEGHDGLTDFTFKVTRSNGNGASTATWTVTGLSADSVENLIGTVEFEAGETEQTVTIQVRGDLTPEPDEAFTVTLSNPQGATLGQASANGKVLNDDGEPPPLPNKAPDGLTLSGASATELAGADTPIGLLSASDPNPGESFTYTLVDSAGGRFKIVGDRLLVDDGFKLDFEQARSHAIIVEVGDKAGATLTRTFTIDVNDLAVERTSGSVGNDVFKAGKHNDVLGGGLGNDVLWGGAGKDTLTGGKGKDAFVFSTKPNKRSNLDKIVDFNVKDDAIWLDNQIFKTLGKKGSEDKPAKLNKAYFTVGSAAKDKNDHVIYDRKTGILSYDADGAGGRDAVAIAALKKNLKMTHKDFFVI